MFRSSRLLASSQKRNFIVNVVTLFPSMSSLSYLLIYLIRLICVRQTEGDLISHTIVCENHGAKFVSLVTTVRGEGVGNKNVSETAKTAQRQHAGEGPMSRKKGLVRHGKVKTPSPQISERRRLPVGPDEQVGVVCERERKQGRKQEE